MLVTKIDHAEVQMQFRVIQGHLRSDLKYSQLILGLKYLVLILVMHFDLIYNQQNQSTTSDLLNKV